LVTHRFRLDQIKEAFEVAVHDETAIKVVLEP
jgi:threonine dehydrogenase-like Zn-dependent dehydrogenase